jgi:hypothetical protein
MNRLATLKNRLRFLLFVILLALCIAVVIAVTLPKLYSNMLFGTLGVFSALMWAISAFLSNEKTLARENDRVAIEGLSEWANFSAALTTAMTSMGFAVGQLVSG